MDLKVRMGEVCYPYRLDTDWLAAMTDRLLELSASRYLIVCDTNTGPLYGSEIAELLSGQARANLLTHPAGEQGKDLAAVSSLMESALELGADRGSVVVAVGGGVTGNIAGLMAALLFRGIRLVHIPTSLIAMLDSVLSLKQAVNASVGKNLVGTFYPPTEVLADTAMLRTLPKREIVSGLCEAIKNSLAIRPKMVGLLADVLNPGACYEDPAMRSIIAECIQAKAMVTVGDERECHAGAVLEYGHTVGHAIEYTSRGELSHGEAVGLGMLAAAEISRILGYLEAPLAALHRQLLAQAGAPLTIPATIDIGEVMHRVRFDNKRGYLRDAEGNSAMVLLQGHGQPVWLGERPLVPVPLALIDEVVTGLAGPAGDGGGMLAAAAPASALPGVGHG